MTTKNYTYELATHSGDRWSSSWHRTAPRHRDPQQIARGVLERWIVDQAGTLPAGRVVVHGRRRAGVTPDAVAARVRVYDGASADRAIQPAAVAYLVTLGGNDRAARWYPRAAR